jgi:hypothetical protein
VVLLRWRIDDVLHLSDVLFVQLRDHVIKVSSLLIQPDEIVSPFG